jgi:hypothetical protein
MWGMKGRVMKVGEEKVVVMEEVAMGLMVQVMEAVMEVVRV